MAKIILDNISKIYGTKDIEIKALDNVSLEMQDNEFVVILGASGAGKSTLLNILGGMDNATSGNYFVDSINVTKKSANELAKFRRNSVGFVFQFYNLMPNLTALENVMLSAKTVKNSLDSKKTLELVGLKDRINNFPSGLSGGEQQRVSIARAIVKNPKLLLCDEPTGALDSKTGKSIIKLLKEISHNNNQTVIVVTHNSNLAYIADRLIRISDGKIIENNIVTNPKEVDEIEW